MPIDSLLEQQLSEAEETSRPVGVWGTLGTPAGKKSLDPNEIAELAHRVIARVEEDSGHRAEAFQIYENLNTFSLNAPPQLIRKLAGQPEVASLRPVRQNQSLAFETTPTTPSEAAAVRRRSPKGGRSRHS